MVNLFDHSVESYAQAFYLYIDILFQYKMVCHTVADRLASLERLRDQFNQKLGFRMENMKKVY